MGHEVEIVKDLFVCRGGGFQPAEFSRDFAIASAAESPREDQLTTSDS